MPKSSVHDLLKRNNLKITPQRSLLLNIIFRHGHIDIETLLAKIKSILPSVSVATVYKNLNTLVENGVVKEFRLPGEKNMYELNLNKHIHLVCSKCKNIKDIEIDESTIKKNFIEIVNEDIRDFNINLYHICENCKKSE